MREGEKKIGISFSYNSLIKYLIVSRRDLYMILPSIIIYPI